MKKDLDTLMKINDLDAIFVTGPAQHNPSMYYTHNLGKYNFDELVKDAGGDQVVATAERYRLILSELGITSGRVAIYGKQDAGITLGVFTALRKKLPDLEFIGEMNDSVLLEAMATKDEEEIKRMFKIGKITMEVVGEVAGYLSSRRVRDNVLVKQDDQPITIRDVKNKINLWLVERGAENPQDCIFAIGRDAGVPHSAGNLDDVLRLGQTIVFDIFPCEAGGGYHHDFTRTWCLGFAPDEVTSMYDDVLAVHQQIMSELEVDTPCDHYQERACEMFEARGHSTLKSDPQTQEGYVHGLGHGVGLHVHERPWFKRMGDQPDKLSPGMVFTVEPGLYYPERGMGCRLEDTVYVRPDGKLESISDFPKDLVVPVRG
jgi:Xaa-Pro aminopeptidase